MVTSVLLRASGPAPTGRRAPVAPLLVLWLAGAVVFTLLAGSRFPSLDTVRSIAFQLPELGFLTLAMAVVMLSGGINLATVATADVSALLLGWLLVAAGPDAGGWAIAGAVGAGLALATAAGALNGVIIAYGGLPPILATLGTMTLYTGVTVALTKGAAISGFPPAVLALGNESVLGIPVPILLFLVGALAVGSILGRTTFGWNVRMIGSNVRATALSGVATRRVLVGLYALSGFLCGLAGLVMAARFNSAKADYGSSYLLVSILAAILGGINPDGGFGRLSGVLLALLILQTAASGFNLLGVDPFLTGVAWGVILLAVLAFARLRRR